jgi:hypothetical protein
MERGALLGELGVRPEDAAWARAEADAIASLVTPRVRLRPIAGLRELLRRLVRAAR